MCKIQTKTKIEGVVNVGTLHDLQLHDTGKESVLYDSGNHRLSALTDGSRILFKQEVSGITIGEVSMNEKELQKAIDAMQYEKKSNKAMEIQEAGNSRTKEEQDAFLMELVKKYDKDGSQVLILGDTYFLAPPTKKGRDLDDSFNYHYMAFIPEKEKVVVITFRVLGGDSYGDRVFSYSSYYRYGELSDYYNKRGGIKVNGKYGEALEKVVELVKEDKEPGFTAREIR